MYERVLNVAALSATALAVGSAPALAAPATDGPGAMSHYALARKDCVGTALTTARRCGSRSPTAC